jgi:hypothetical protein
MAGQTLKKFSLIDVSLVLLFLLVVGGLLAVKTGVHKTSGETIKSEATIDYTILLRNLKTLQPDLFKKGEKLSITIRNQPRGEVLIVDSEVSPKKLAVPKADGTVQVINDPADQYGYDYLVKLRDHALVTDTGYVTEGIKVKIGLPIEVEGINYRVTGIIADIQKAPLNTPVPTSSAPSESAE